MDRQVKSRTEKLSSFSILGQKARDYYILVKFRLTLTVVFSAVMAYLITANGVVNWQEVLLLALGGFLVTSAANALNQVLEKDFDKLMKRTADRPVAAGRMSISEGVMAAGLMSLTGISILALFNVWAAFFGMLAVIIYAFIYTPTKRFSTVAVLVGAIPGAMPMLIGSVAFSGELTMLAFALFAVQFFWQFPHFWAIGWLGFDEYQKAGYQLLPTKNGKADPAMGLQALWYSVMLCLVGILPFYLGITGVFSAIIASILALILAFLGWQLYQKKNRKSALALMFSSLIYLPVTLILFYIDKI